MSAHMNILVAPPRPRPRKLDVIIVGDRCGFERSVLAVCRQSSVCQSLENFTLHFTLATSDDDDDDERTSYTLT